MKIKVAVVEDEDKFATVITDYINRFGSERGYNFAVDRFADGDEIVEDYKAGYDVIFFDIQMKRFDGMSAAKEIRKLDKSVNIVFVTNLAQYAIKGYSVDAFNFLLKPVSYPVFQALLKKLVAKIKAQAETTFIKLPSKNGFTKLDTDDICYIESFRHKITVYTLDASYTLSGILIKFQEKLNSNKFFKCGRSYIINLSYIKALSGTEVEVGPHKIIISRLNRKNLLDALTDYNI